MALTGNDVKNLFDDLELTPIVASRLVGIELKHFHTLVGYGNISIGPEVPIPQLSMELLVELWGIVETTIDTNTEEGKSIAKNFGTELTKAMNTHGQVYAAWLIINERCSRIFEEESLTHDDLECLDTQY